MQRMVTPSAAWYIVSGSHTALTAPETHHRIEPMTDTARAAALAELATRLAQLMTAEERRTYPALDHLTDLIDDLEGDA